MLTMGIIGFGKSAKRYHLPYLLIKNNIKVKTIFDINIDKEESKKSDYKEIQFTNNIDELLMDPQIQLVTICTPGPTHFELAKKAIESGKSVVVEKPFCDSSQHAEELFKLAKEMNVVVMPFQNRRFDSDYLAVKEVIDKGYLGDLLEIECHIDYFRPNMITPKGKKEDGAFYSLGIHLLDRMVALFGAPETVSYDIRNNREKAGLDNYFDVDLHYNHQFKVKVKCNHLTALKYPRFIIHGTKGSFIKFGEDQQENDLKVGMKPNEYKFGNETPDKYGILKYIDSSGDWIEKKIESPMGDYGKFYDYLYESIIHGTDKLVADKDVITTLKILEEGFIEK